MDGGHRIQSERETGEERFARGWANRGNGQVAYLWQPYFGYMNWFPSKVSDVASRLFNLKMYREVSRRVRHPARFATGHPQPGVTRSLIHPLPTASMDNDEPFSRANQRTKPREISGHRKLGQYRFTPRTMGVLRAQNTLKYDF